MLSNIKILPEKIQNKVRKVFEKNNLDINTRAEDIAMDAWHSMI